MFSNPSRALVWVIVVLSCSALPATAAVDVGDKPLLAFNAANGGAPTSLAKYKGKIIVVDFWATWCGPCMAEAGHMVQVNTTYAPKGLQFIGISLDDNAQDMNRVAKENGFTWPQMCDGGVWRSKPAVSWGVNSIPQTFVIGPDGSVLWRGHPANLDGALAAAFKQHPPQLVEPKILADAVAAADKIDAALKAEGQTSTIALLATVPAAAKADPAFAARIATIENQLDAIAAKSLEEIDTQIKNKQYVEASGKLNEIVLALATKPSGFAAKKRLSELMANPQAKAQIDAVQKNKAAEVELADAKRLQGEGNDEQAFVKFKGILSNFPGTPSADAAKQAVATYEKNPAFTQKANDAAAAAKTKPMLLMAQNYLKAGRPDLAKAKYHDIIIGFPGTTAAKQAKDAIEEIDAAGK